MKGFVFIAVGLALVYVAYSGKVPDLIIALFTGQSPNAQTPAERGEPLPIPGDGTCPPGYRWSVSGNACIKEVP